MCNLTMTACGYEVWYNGWCRYSLFEMVTVLLVLFRRKLICVQEI